MRLKEMKSRWYDGKMRRMDNGSNDRCTVRVTVRDACVDDVKAIIIK